MLDAMPNMAPFATPTEEILFRLRLVPELAAGETKPVFHTDDGPGFPEISIEETEQGWLFRMSAQPGNPLACELLTSRDFSTAQLHLLGPDKRFGLNNSLMLLFAFASAREGALEMHASVVMQDGKGYLFLGRSGTGKSTHSSLWMKHIPGTELLNDDNPILRLMPDGSARVFGSPWSGKTPCYKALDVPVGAVVRIRQAPFNKIERLPLVQAYASLMASASGFRPLPGLADAWHHSLEGIAAQVPCFVLDCLPDQAAAELCYRTVHG